MRPSRCLYAATLVLVLVLAPLPVFSQAQDAGFAGSQSSARVPPSACRALISETIGTDPLPVCRTTEVTVTMALTCPTSLPMHIVFTIGKHLLMEDHLDEVKASARSVLDQIEFTPGTMVGVVTLSAQSRTELELTEHKSLAVSAINRIRLDRIDPTVRYYDWIGKAQQMLEEARSSTVSPVEVIVLYSTGCPIGFESYCERQAGSANKAKGQDMTIVGVCNPDARPFGIPWPQGHCLDVRKIASNGWYYDLQKASQVGPDVTALGREGSSLSMPNVTLVEQLAAVLLPVPGSPTGSPSTRIEDREVVWDWSDLGAGSSLTATYRLSPTIVGRTPIRLPESAVDIVDSIDRESGPFPVPTRVIDVIPCVEETPTREPSATATPSKTPTATSSPAPSPTNLPTATALSAPIYLPIALKMACRSAEQHTDVVLAIDSSSSMRGKSGSVTKLDAAKSAALSFIELLDLGEDQAAVVSFDERARLDAPLTEQSDELAHAIAAIVTHEGTRLDLALALSTQELTSVRVRPENNQVIILLTDGQPTEGTSNDVLAEAQSAKANSLLIYAVGLGDDVDADLLSRVTTDPSFVLLAPDASDLNRIYEEIAGSLPCPGGAIWDVAAP